MQFGVCASGLDSYLLVLSKVGMSVIFGHKHPFLLTRKDEIKKSWIFWRRRSVRIRFNFKIPKFNNEGYFEALMSYGEDLMFKSAQAGLRAMLTKAVQGRGVPVLTGMSRGTLRPLGRYLKTPVPIKPKIKRRDRSPRTGERLAEPPPYITRDKQRVRFEFRFSNVMKNGKAYHFFLNEFYATNAPGTPWKAFETFSKAMRKYWNDHFDPPALGKFTTWSRID